MRAMHVNTTSKRRRRPAIAGLALAAALLSGACGSADGGSSDETEAPAVTTVAGDTATTAAEPATTTAADTATTAGDTATTTGAEAPSGDLAALEAACQEEGKVNLIAL